MKNVAVKTLIKPKFPVNTEILRENIFENSQRYNAIISVGGIIPKRAFDNSGRTMQVRLYR